MVLVLSELLCRSRLEATGLAALHRPLTSPLSSAPLWCCSASLGTEMLLETQISSSVIPPL